MKAVIVNNLSIQLDIPETCNDFDTVLNIFDNINRMLKEQFPAHSPQIFTEGISNTDIENSLNV